MVDISVLGAQIRAARALLGLSQEALATEAKITRVTLVGLENGRRLTYDSTVQKVVTVLEAQGISFVSEGGRVGVFVSSKAVDG